MPRGSKLTTELESDVIQAALIAAARLQTKTDFGLDVPDNQFDGAIEIAADATSAVITFTKAAAQPAPPQPAPAPVQPQPVPQPAPAMQAAAVPDWPQQQKPFGGG